MSFLTAYNATYPLLVPRTITTIILGSSLGTAQSFTMAKGYVVLTFTDSSTGYAWSFGLSGGYEIPNRLVTPNSALFAYPATAIGCTVTPKTFTAGVSTTVQVVTPGGDSGGRTYTLTFFVVPGILATIQQTAGTAPATNLVASSLDHLNAFP